MAKKNKEFMKSDSIVAVISRVPFSHRSEIFFSYILYFCIFQIFFLKSFIILSNLEGT